MGEFDLEKWYLDLVTPEGHAVIAYAARLRLGRLSLGYASLLEAPPEGAPRCRARLGRFCAPRAEAGGALAFACRPLGLRARLVPLDPPAQETFYQGAEGSVHWRCDAPRARAAFELDGRRLEGLGYAERVRLTLPPWRLPIEELRWGRALGESGSVVWVDWSGGRHRARLVLRDGRPVAAGAVTEAGIDGADGAPLLRLGQGRVLRGGWLSHTVGKGLPAPLRAVLPARALRLHESKWCAPATLPGGAPALAIHEVVRWG